MADFFSTNLKYLREQKNLSQNKLGKMIGVNQTTIARWEADNRIPTIDNAIDVSEALNIPLPDLLGKDLRLQNKETERTYTTTIYTDDEYKLQLQTDKPFDTLSEEEREKIVQQAMDELFEYKRSLKNK